MLARAVDNTTRRWAMVMGQWAEVGQVHGQSRKSRVERARHSMQPLLSHVRAVDLGFDASGFVTLEVVPVDQSADSMRSYYPSLLERLGQPLTGNLMKTAVRANGRVVQPTPNIHPFLPGAVRSKP